MYLILVYDVAQERVGKVCRTLRRRLTWVQNSVFEGEVTVKSVDELTDLQAQNSVFEGEVTEAEFARIEAELAEVIDSGSDSVLCYCIRNPKGWEKRVFGQERLNTDTFL